MICWECDYSITSHKGTDYQNEVFLRKIAVAVIGNGYIKAHKTSITKIGCKSSKLWAYVSVEPACKNTIYQDAKKKVVYFKFYTINLHLKAISAQDCK